MSVENLGDPRAHCARLGVEGVEEILPASLRAGLRTYAVIAIMLYHLVLIPFFIRFLYYIFLLICTGILCLPRARAEARLSVYTQEV